MNSKLKLGLFVLLSTLSLSAFADLYFSQNPCKGYSAKQGYYDCQNIPTNHDQPSGWWKYYDLQSICKNTDPRPNVKYDQNHQKMVLVAVNLTMGLDAQKENVYGHTYSSYTTYHVHNTSAQTQLFHLWAACVYIYPNQHPQYIS